MSSNVKSKKPKIIIQDEDVDVDVDVGDNPKDKPKDKEETKEIEQIEPNIISLQLGDVISIIDPTSDVLNNNTFIIDYIDKSKLKLINVEDLNSIQIRISEEGVLSNGTITTIDILYRNDKLGYARQNGLIPGTWVNIYFGGDTPVIISGEITNLEEDMIEIKVYPDNDTIYINFSYKGIPEDLPIDKIEIRNSPEKIILGEPKSGLGEPKSGEEENEKENEKEKEKDESIDYEVGEVSTDELKFLEIEKEQRDIIPLGVKNQQREFIIRADEIFFGNELGPITQFIDVDPSQKRFNIEMQTGDLLDNLLSKIPTPNRSISALNNIHIIVERYKQLRNQFSEFDNYGNILGSKIKSANWKPLVNDLMKMKTLLYWILPVVKNVKKIYDITENDEEDIDSDVKLLESFEDIEEIKTILDNYKSNNSPSENKYFNMMIDLNQHFTPFEEINPEFVDDILYNFNVENDVNTIVDNLGNYSSSVTKDNATITRRFIIQKYNTELTRLETSQLTGSKMISQRVKLTNPDVLQIKSIMSLPEPTIRFSNINLPGTNILDKANLNTTFLNYWQLLKQNTAVKNVNVENLETEIDFDENNFANNIKSYILNLKKEYEDIPKQEVYNKYLNAIIPKTRVLFNLMKKYINGKLSIKDVVGFLEPFLIYTDDLSYMQFKEINQFIATKIVDYNKKFLEKNKIFFKLKKILSNDANCNSITSLIKNHEIYSNVFKTNYKIDENNKLTSSELLPIIKNIDFGNLLNSAISLENLNLMLTQDISSLLEEQTAELESEITEKTAQNKCNTFIIAKQYSNIEELINDNGKQIYFDRKYDKTVYSIIEDYEKEQLKMTPEDFNEFLINKLKTKYKYNEKDSEYLSETIINGVKKVVNGNYAVLFVDTENKVKYYIRQSNRWEEDERVTSDSFNANDDSLLCNFQTNCIDVQNNMGNHCDSYDLNKTELKKQTIKTIINEFDKKYQLSKDELETKINKQYDYYSSIINKLIKIHHHNDFKYNNKQYNLGLTIEDSPTDIVLSPFIKLRDSILGQSDFVKKQYDLGRFIINYTRKSIVSENEDSNWAYCIETSTKLLPFFICKLAMQFFQDPRLYNNTMDEIIKTNGALSDDGDAWVDKYSGYVIRKIDYDVSEGYEEGFKTTTRDVLEQDAGDVLLNGAPKTIAKYQTPETQMASNVISTLAENMGINIEPQREFMITIITNTIGIALPKEEDYKTRVTEMAKKGKTMPEYKKVYNVTILYLTLGAFLIGIQVSIPSIKTRKTFPGCVRSFIGFPFDGDGDISALTYLSCIAYKIRKSSSDPWSGFIGIKETVIPTKIKETIENYYLVNVDVIQKIKEKTEYLLSNPENDKNIPAEHDLSKWNNFLPPLISFKINHLENISEGFKKELLKDLKTGSKNQHEKMLVIESKIILFSLAIQEKIQKIVSSKQLLLTNSASEPFLENACCVSESRNETTTMNYFENEDAEIAVFNENVTQLSNIIYDIKHTTIAPFIFSQENTKNIYSSLSDEYNEETIYITFISLCKFNSVLPINPELTALCNSKPDFLHVGDLISEKISKLKQDGRNYNNDSLLRLLQIVGRQNIVNLPALNQEVTVTPIQKIRDILDRVIDTGDVIIPPLFIQKVINVMDTFDIGVTEDTKEMRDLKNYLSKSNAEMKQEIVDFLMKNGKLSNLEKNKVKNIINTLLIWEDIDSEVDSLSFENLVKSKHSMKKKGEYKKDDEDEDDEDGGESRRKRKHVNKYSISDDAMYNIINFLKCYIQNILKTFPNIISNLVNYQNIKIPAYMKLSQKHANDIKHIIHTYYSSLSEFYKKKSLTRLINNIQIRTELLLLLANNTPAFADINYKEMKNHSIFDRKTSLLLYENYFLLAINEYINLSKDNSMIVREMRSSVEDDNELVAITVDSLEDNEPSAFLTSRMLTGNKKELQGTTADLLVTFLNIMNDHKNTVDLSYDKIMDLIFKTTEREKDTFTDRLKAKSDEERSVDTILKINKLGVWNKGLQKGLTSYVKETYDDEREFMENLTEIEKNVMKNKNVTDRNIDQYMDDYLEERDTDKMIDEEEYNMGGLTEDYMDGDYQGENEENFGDYD